MRNVDRKKPTHVYVGFKDCGCWVAIVNDEPDDPKFTSREVAGFIKRGYRVERMSFEQWRSSAITSSYKCPHRGTQTEQMVLPQ